MKEVKIMYQFKEGTLTGDCTLDLDGNSLQFAITRYFKRNPDRKLIAIHGYSSWIYAEIIHGTVLVDEDEVEADGFPFWGEEPPSNVEDGCPKCGSYEGNWQDCPECGHSIGC